MWFRRGLDFVPEGLNDRSDSTELAEVQAIYCLGQAKWEDPSRRGRYDRCPGMLGVRLLCNSVLGLF